MFIRNLSLLVSRGVAAAALLLASVPAKADTFGSGANAFTIDFVNVGNAGNANDTGAGGGIYSSPYGGVPYHYRIGTYEITQDAIVKATASGLTGVATGPWSGNQPAANVTWLEAAAFVNWLNTSTGHHAAYQLDAGATALTLWTSAEAWQAGGENRFRHKDAKYFLPSEDEWYKAAFHKNDGATANYWDYATASNTIPTPVAFGNAAGTAVYNPATNVPTTVDNNGGLSAYGTRGQTGNVWELHESASDGINDLPSEDRTIRGGDWNSPNFRIDSSYRYEGDGAFSNFHSIGFRIASAGAAVNNPGGVFVTGHDPDFHAVLGANFVGARNTFKRAVEYVTYNKLNPRLLLVTDVRNPGGVQCDSRRAMPVCGFTNYAVADYGSGTAGVLNLNTVQFSDYDAIIVASDFGGWLRQDELDILNSRTAEILSYVNNGGGLVVLSEAGNRGGGAYPGTAHSRYGFLPFLISAIDLNQHESNITVTPAGTALGLTNADVNGNFSHSYFSASGGMDVIDKDASGRALTLATRKSLTTTGVSNPTNLIVNGGFEAGAFVNNTSAPGFMILFPGETAITGWTVSSDDILWGINSNLEGLTSSEGNRFLDLTGANTVPFGGVTQSISTVAGATYAVEFDLGVLQGGEPTFAGPISITVGAGDSSQVFVHNPPGTGNVWGRYTFLFTAESSSTAITFQGLTGRNHIGLDNVVMNAPQGGLTELPVITIGGPAVGGIPIFGTANPANPGHTTGTISGTGHPGCIIEVTVSDPTHTESTANNSIYTTTVGADGNWSLTLTLDDCHPFISIVQICDGVRSGPVSWQTHVDGTPPVFVGGGAGGGGPGSGTFVTGGGGTATITLVGTASDPDTHIPGGGVSYEWYLITPGSGGTETRELLSGGGGGTLVFEGEPGEYSIEIVVTDSAGNRLVKRCMQRILPAPPVIIGGVPTGTVIWGGGGAGVDLSNPGHVTGTIRGTGHAGCTIEVTVSDPTHPDSTANNMAYTTLVGDDGTWSIDLTLDDCHPAISIVQICDGMRSEPVSWQVYVDGTAPIFIIIGGPGDGIDTAGSGGTAWIILNGGASDPDTHIPGGGVAYRWYLIGGGGVRTLLSGNGSTFEWEVEPGIYIIEVEVSDGAGNLLVKRCVRRVIPAPPEIDGGIPATGAIFGTADPAHLGHTTGTISGTGHHGCTIELTVSDPTHAESTANNQTYTTTVDEDGHWSFDLTLDDCHPTISIVQVCNGMPSAPVTWQIYVDGTPPVLIGGLADGIDYISTSGFARIALDGSASDDSHVPGGLSYRWTVIGADGIRRVMSTDPACMLELPLGDWTVELLVTDPAGNALLKSCVRRVLKRPTTLGCPELTASFGDNVTLNATLLDGLTNLPISGKVITYQLNGQPVSSVFSALWLPGVYEIFAAFAGDDIYQPCTALHACHLTINATPGKITGGGSTDERVRNFGFIAQVKTQGSATSFSGNLEFQDKALGVDLKSTAITMIAISSDRLHGAFTGTATNKQAQGYTFTVWIDDLAEPGSGVDKFRVEIKGPGGFTYDSAQVATKGGILDKGGNIQIHKAQ